VEAAGAVDAHDASIAPWKTRRKRPLTAVPIRLVSSGTFAEPGTPLALFATTLATPGAPVNRQLQVVAPDGQSFVMKSAVGEAIASPITVILNWDPKTPGR